MKRLGLMIAALAVSLTLVACPKERPAETTKPGSSTTTTTTTTTSPTSVTGTGTTTSTKSPRMEYSALPPAIQVQAATGKKSKYSNPLAAFEMASDEKDNSAHSEYGWREAITDPKSDAFKKYGPAPAGWWVYVAPYWVVFNLKDGKAGP